MENIIGDAGIRLDLRLWPLVNDPEQLIKLLSALRCLTVKVRLMQFHRFNQLKLRCYILSVTRNCDCLS
jgi:hypothetical protein